MIPLPRDKDQDTSKKTHCAGDDFIKSKSGAWRRGGWWHGGMDCSRALPTAPEIFWWWKSPEEGGWWPKDFKKPKAQLGASHWIKAEMLLIPSKSLPFEPNPGQNQTTCVLRGQDDDISSSGDADADADADADDVADADADADADANIDNEDGDDDNR